MLLFIGESNVISSSIPRLSLVRLPTRKLKLGANYETCEGLVVWVFFLVCLK